MVKNILQEFKLAGYDLEIKYNAAKVGNDVSRFLEDSSELGLLESKTFVNLLTELDENN